MSSRIASSARRPIPDGGAVAVYLSRKFEGGSRPDLRAWARGASLGLRDRQIQHGDYRRHARHETNVPPECTHGEVLPGMKTLDCARGGVTAQYDAAPRMVSGASTGRIDYPVVRREATNRHPGDGIKRFDDGRTNGRAAHDPLADARRLLRLGVRRAAVSGRLAADAGDSSRATDVQSATIIVAAFMAGLGVGHLAGGHVADRVSRSHQPRTVRRCGIGDRHVRRVQHVVVLRRVVSASGCTLPGRRTPRPSCCSGRLLLPTFFMGASLPLLARAVTDRLDRAARAVGALYGFNTLGAATGAAVATWVLLPGYGLEGSLRVGAMLNVACAAVLLPFALRSSGASGGSATASIACATPPDAGHVGQVTFRMWALTYGSRRIRRAVVRDCLVQAARRHDEVHRIHIRDAPDAVSGRPWDWCHGWMRPGTAGAAAGGLLLRIRGGGRIVRRASPGDLRRRRR